MSFYVDPYRKGAEKETGKDEERYAFGDPELDKNQRFAKEYRELFKKGGNYVSYKDALALIKRNYTLDPHHPTKPFATDLRVAVADGLGLSTNDELNRLKFYSSVNTVFDLLHGVDGFLIYEHPEKGEIVVTLDVTKNPNKLRAKADLLIANPIVDPEEDEKRYLTAIEMHAQEVVKKIQEKLATQKLD